LRVLVAVERVGAVFLGIRLSTVSSRYCRNSYDTIKKSSQQNNFTEPLVVLTMTLVKANWYWCMCPYVGH